MPQVYRSNARINPAAPDGGHGPGHFVSYPGSQPQPDGWFWGAVHWTEHFPAAVYHEARHVAHETEEFAIRTAYVAEAVYLANEYADGAIVAKLGMDVEELKKAFLPGLLMSLAVLAVTTLAGAVAGGILAGIFSGGSLALPAAVAGGELGLEAGFAILDAIGIAFLIRDVIEFLPKILHKVHDAVSLAWYAGTNPREPAITAIEKGAHGLSEAVADLVNVVVEGVLIWILSKSAVGKAGKLTKSTGNLSDPAILAARGGEVMRSLQAKSAEVETALREGAAELAGVLRKAGSLTRGLADFVEKKIDLIVRNVTDGARKRIVERKGAGGGEQNSGRGSGGKDGQDAAGRSWNYQDKQVGRDTPGRVPETPELRAESQAARTLQAPIAPSGWPDLPTQDAQTFGADPQPVTLDPGTKLYRVIGNDKDGPGPYWSTEPPPDSEADWRAGSAVKDDWNGDGGYVEYTVPTNAPLNAWGGPAAPQDLTGSGYVLPGGQNQIWVPRGTIIPDGPPQPTPWNH